jgi:hypothetical protein
MRILVTGGPAMYAGVGAGVYRGLGDVVERRTTVNRGALQVPEAGFLRPVRWPTGA